MYEAAQTDIGSQFVRIPAVTLRLDSFPQQADSTRQVHRCCGRVANQITEGKEVLS